MVGFNRRFSPLAVELKRRLAHAPMGMIYRVNAGAIAPDSWIQDLEVGGGRMIGEGCHFVDFMTFLCGAKPILIVANVLSDPRGLADTLSVQLTFENGSIGTLHYFANGSKAVPKEYCEVYQNGMTAILDDFKSLRVLGSGKPFRKKLINQNKGQAEMVHAVLASLKCGADAPISFDELASTTLATFAAIESATTREVVNIAR
jgi:predicted dehydrogenase